MNKQKLVIFLFVLAIVLFMAFAILLLLPETKDNTIGRIGLWCGLVSQFLLASAMYSEIHRIKKGEGK